MTPRDSRNIDPSMSEWSRWLTESSQGTPVHVQVAEVGAVSPIWIVPRGLEHHFDDLALGTAVFV